MPFVVFWICLAAVIIVGALNSRRNLELRHETIRAMLEKGEKLDESVVQSLLKPHDPYKSVPGRPGDAYRVMRVIGTLLLFLAPGVALPLILGGYANHSQGMQLVGIALGSSILLLGAGLHVASRYVDAPAGR